MNVRLFLNCALAIFSMVAADSFAQDRNHTRIDHILGGLRPPVAIKNRPPVRWTLAERMQALHIPGISMAIIDSGRVFWAGAFGVRHAGSTDSVTSSTLFQAQSISKPVSATATLRLVEAGSLSLDENINVYLSSWKLPENAFTKHVKVTLRRILSHSAGLTVGGFGGYRLGDSIPTLPQILDGKPPANTPPIRVDTIPGSVSRYSGGGYLVVQQLLIDATGETFPTLMKRLVLDPVGMDLSTFEQPLPKHRWNETASGHDARGEAMKGNWPIHPEMAAAGLWTTPTELAHWALALADAYTGHSDRLLSKAMATQMLTEQKAPFGLGLVLGGKDQTLSFGHSGANLGFRAEFVLFPAQGKGAVIMTNGDLGSYLIDELFQSIAAEFQWFSHRQAEREAIVLTSDQLDGLVGVYNVPGPFGPAILYEVSRKGDRLFAELKGFSPKLEIFAASTDTLFASSGYTIAFVRDSSGRAAKVKLGGQIEASRKD